MKRKKLSISTLLFSALGLIAIFKVFIYVIEHFVFQTTGENGLKVDQSDLNKALAVIVILLVIRISYVVVKHKLVRSSNIRQNDSNIEVSLESLVCAECGKKVSEKVREYCLDRPNKFSGKVYCYDHQKTMNQGVSK